VSVGGSVLELRGELFSSTFSETSNAGYLPDYRLAPLSLDSRLGHTLQPESGKIIKTLNYLRRFSFLLKPDSFLKNPCFLISLIL